MSKAILVIDTPKSCYGCNFCKFEGVYKRNYYGRACLLTGEYVQKEFDITTVRHNTCPLKPMPEKKDSDNALFYKDYFEGYNACIDEIIGEDV